MSTTTNFSAIMLLQPYKALWIFMERRNKIKGIINFSVNPAMFSLIVFLNLEC
uniref:Uncharacterized protein n=1 Tax=Lepeophtheirus salmonis TaxID=72036 RepID=A0A0K2VJ14_LEPSM